MSNRRKNFSNWLKMYARKIAVALIVISIAIGAWANLLLNINASINNKNKRNSPLILAVKLDKDEISKSTEKKFSLVTKPDYIQLFLF